MFDEIVDRRWDRGWQVSSSSVWQEELDSSLDVCALPCPARRTGTKFAHSVSHTTHPLSLSSSLKTVLLRPTHSHFGLSRKLWNFG